MARAPRVSDLEIRVRHGHPHEVLRTPYLDSKHLVDLFENARALHAGNRRRRRRRVRGPSRDEGHGSHAELPCQRGWQQEQGSSDDRSRTLVPGPVPEEEKRCGVFALGRSTSDDIRLWAREEMQQRVAGGAAYIP